MDAVDLGVNLFVTLFALLDPIGNLPIFAAATAGATLRQRISVSALICAFAAVFLAFFLFTGLALLQFFGISLAAFRIAGGILLILGLFTRPAAFILSGQMAVAYFMAHASQGSALFPLANGGESAVLFCFVFLYLAAAGPGAYSLDGRGRRF